MGNAYFRIIPLNENHKFFTTNWNVNKICIKSISGKVLVYTVQLKALTKI